MNEDPKLPSRSYPARQAWAPKGNQSVIIFVTVCSKNRQPVLAEPEIHELVVNEWRKADTWIVGKYVILPDHIHLFAAPNGEGAPNLHRWVSYWKSQVSRSWPFDHDGSIWQKDVWDRQLRSGESYAQKWHYVRDNPVRHKLVSNADDWIFQGELNVLAWHEE